MTTFQGNRFRFMDGNPAETASKMTKVFQSLAPQANASK